MVIQIKLPTKVKPKPIIATNKLAPTPKVIIPVATSKLTKGVIPKPKVGITAASIATNSKLTNPEPAKVAPSQDILLDSAEATFSPTDSITEKLGKIDALLGAEDIPVPRLRAGLMDVMRCLKDNEGSILELEPESIKLIVRGYTLTAGAEIQRIVTGKKKTTAKKAVKELAVIAKTVDLDEVEF
jgi:hypothetical protein